MLGPRQYYLGDPCGDWYSRGVKKELNDLSATLGFGERIGARCRGGEVIELIGDVGAGKTTLAKGIARGLRIDEDVQSPSFTLSREYVARDGLELHHYDFYRLAVPGIMSHELAESIADPRVVTVIEWAETVADVLPDDRLKIHLQPTAEGESRDATIEAPSGWDYLELAT